MRRTVRQRPQAKRYANDDDDEEEGDEDEYDDDDRPNRTSGRAVAVGYNSSSGGANANASASDNRSRRRYRQYPVVTSTSSSNPRNTATASSMARTNEKSSSSSSKAKKISSRRSDGFFSSSSSSDEDDDDDEMEDDDMDDDDMDDDDSYSENSSSHGHGQQQGGRSSEFDKAARSGKGPSHSELPQQPQQQYGGRASKHKHKAQTPSQSSRDSSSFGSVQNRQHKLQQQHQHQQYDPQYDPSGATTEDGSADDHDPLSSGVLPDALMTMRQKIESLTLFDSDMMKLVNGANHPAYSGGMAEDPIAQETRESLKRSSQQSISPAVLVSLAHKRYERRRLAAMEIEKVVRGLAQKGEEQLERVRAILLLLSDDYVRSTSEDARKGGVVALAASAIGLKKTPVTDPIAHECRDLILASVVHACQDQNQRVRYYATESLFNVIKVIPSLAVQHFFILFEILRSLYADVDDDVKCGAELLDKKLKDVIVVAMNTGQFTAEACVPVFARFVYMNNKDTKRLTLTWLQELTEKLIGAPILEFLHLFLTGIFDMIADPQPAIKQSALAFLQSVLPKLLDNHVVEEAIDDFQTAGIKVNFDKILQSLVTTMEHPDPFVRKIAMYWMSRIVKAHIGGEKRKQVGKSGSGTVSAANSGAEDDVFRGLEDGAKKQQQQQQQQKQQQSTDGSSGSQKEPATLSAATISVRNSLPHVLPGILLSIGDNSHRKSANREYFLPDTTTHTLADQTNACLQNAVRKDGKAYVQHLDSFIVALREELDSPGGVNARNPPALERRPYRMDVKFDGSGIESQGWFRASDDTKESNVDSMMMSRLCALHWIIVLYESVVPDVLKADYAREFIIPIIHQLVDDPPERIIYKSLEVLAKITVPVKGESVRTGVSPNSLSGLALSSPSWAAPPVFGRNNDEPSYPMTDDSIGFALEILDKQRSLLRSRDREVFSALIQLYSCNLHLIGDLSRVISYMCRLQPPEFVFASFAVELDNFVRRQAKTQSRKDVSQQLMSQDYQFVSAFIQQMCLVLLNSKEAFELRDVLKDCIGYGREAEERDRRKSRLFHILLHSFSHNLVAATSLCLWGGACRTASLFLKRIDPLDISLVFLLELDKLVEMIERPLFRHLHVRMLETDKNPLAEGSGTMLFQVLKSILMMLPQSACYNVLRDRLVSTSRFRQSVIANDSHDNEQNLLKETDVFVSRVLSVRRMHCRTVWETIRAESLESISARSKPSETKDDDGHQTLEEGADRRQWLGYTSVEEEEMARARYRQEHKKTGVDIEEITGRYNEFSAFPSDAFQELAPNDEQAAATAGKQSALDPGSAEDVNDGADQVPEWKNFWSASDLGS